MRAIPFLFLLLTIPAFGSTEPQDDLVSTPGGPRLASRVHRIDPGQFLRKNGVVFEIVDRESGRVVTRTEPMSPALQSPRVADSGWIVDTSWTAPGGEPVSSFASVWTVPANPPTQANQLLYLFNGLMDGGGTVILQPVLQWGVSPAGGGSYWAIASWYVTDSGDAFYSALTQVSPGQTLTGVMTLTNSANGTYDYQSTFVGVTSSTLAVTKIAPLPWATETLEAYGVNDCGDYPAGGTAFRGISLRTPSGTPALAWGTQTFQSDCGQSASIFSNSPDTGAVELFYGR